MAPEEAVDRAVRAEKAVEAEYRPPGESQMWKFRRDNSQLPMGDPRVPWSSDELDRPDN